MTEIVPSTVVPWSNEWRNDCCGPLADIPVALTNVRSREQSGHRSRIAKCPLMTQSGHSSRRGLAPELLKVTDFRAYNSVTMARDMSQSTWAKLTSFSLTEKHTSG